MKCRICGLNIGNDCPACAEPPTSGDHVHHRAPYEPDLCLECWKASVDLEMFLARSGRHAPMGNWTEGWLNEILKDPARYL